MLLLLTGVRALAVPQKKGTPTGRVISFKLNAATPYPRMNTALVPIPEPPIATAQPGMIAIGAGKYGAYCAGCHGFGAISGFVTPDLRRSGYIQSSDAFRTVVEDGILLNQGMPKFGPGLSAEDAEAIRAFLVSEARYIYDEHAHPHGVSTPAADGASAEHVD
jgi:quinohemoprotein ethanol dehydrogenase